MATTPVTQRSTPPQPPAAPQAATSPPPHRSTSAPSRLGETTVPVGAGPQRPAAAARAAAALAAAAARPPTHLEFGRSVGLLAQTFGRNMNPIVRAVAQGVQDGSIATERFQGGTARRYNVVQAVGNLLTHRGIDGGNNDLAARNIVRLAQGLDIDPMHFTTLLIAGKRDDEALLAKFEPKHPLLVDGAQPQTITRATDYVSALFAQGVKIPPVKAEVEIDGALWTGTIKAGGLHTTAMNSDIDGPFAASYGQQGIDVEVGARPGGATERFHLRLPEALPGQLLGVEAKPGDDGPPMAVVRYRTGKGAEAQTHALAVEITPAQQQVLRSGNPQAVKLDYVEGLSARFFSAESVDFWQQVSQRNARGGEFPANVKAPAIVFNTFGSHGTRAFENSAELVTSFARSVQGRTLPTPVPPGIVDAPNVRVYSGGTTLNEAGTATPIGLSPVQQQAMSVVAGKVSELVAVYAEEYDLSPEAREAWQSSIFANPDIPSVIVPNKMIAEMAARTSETHPGKTYADLQGEIERDLSALVSDLDMGQFVKLHHTPSAPGDTVAAMKPLDAQGKRPEFTTEWQFAVTGQKAMPVLDAVSNDLNKNFGIDLKAVLEADGHSYGEIRKMSLDDTVNFLGGYVRQSIERQAGGREVTPHVIVPVDTYYEKGGKIDGSDASLIRSAVALYGAEKTCVVQVDTGGGKETVGRSPLFRITADAQGVPQLERSVDGDGKGPVDPHGPNGKFAPTLYVRSADDMGKVFSEAYRRQSPLDAAELEQVRTRA